MAEIDISKLSYNVYLLRETGEMLNVTQIASGISWEESDSQLATHMSLKLANIKHNGKYMSSIAKPNCYLIVKASYDGTSKEVARCKISDWTMSLSGSSDEVSLAGYDELYDLQKSQDDRYVSDGTSTKAAIEKIFSDWGIPVGKYEGPETACAKTVYKSDYLSDILLELLDNALKHGAADCYINASEGKVSVQPKGSNTNIYVFEEGKNLINVDYKISTTDMVTVVKVVAPTEDDDGRRAAEAIVKGKTEYGKRQKIYKRGKDDNLATAKAAAQQILDEDGQPTETMSVKVPDVPFVRKYDKVKIKSRAFSGDMLVESVTHDADGKTMSMDLTKFSKVKTTDTSKSTSTTTASSSSGGDIKKGDIVQFAGGVHYYTSMDSSPRGGQRTAGKAWVQNINMEGKHQYALIGGAYKSGIGGSSNVYGWVDASLVSK